MTGVLFCVHRRTLMGCDVLIDQVSVAVTLSQAGAAHLAEVMVVAHGVNGSVASVAVGALVLA